ncbi:hypothetical protein EWB00_009515 [Schistosoma japonicum]|uniref:Uncharacterized protein n=1 Tax=Schistosoma japonicum TaxID=6182 RepID=A0A4Z2CM18_SCHJA|nr:hypothetical protein EWB00_009515 [Schistosoma japonicum]
MLVPVKQMTYLLYWSIILTMSSSIHLLNNTVTQDVAHYTDSMSTDLKELVSPNPSLPVKKKDRFLITGLTINIHQMTFKSFIIFLSGVVYMGDVFNNGDQIRSIRIVNSSSTGNYMNVSTYSNAFCILTDKLNYCNTNPKATAIFRICFFEDGIMQYNIVGSSSESENCNMTIEIANGIYNGSADGNGTIIKESVIHTVVYPGSIIVGDNTLTIAPLPRCLAQTFCNTCIAESLLNESVLGRRITTNVCPIIVNRIIYRIYHNAII